MAPGAGGAAEGPRRPSCRRGPHRPHRRGEDGGLPPPPHHAIVKSSQEEPRFILLYPRRALVQDQIRRVFRYVRRAQDLYGRRIRIGLQMEGVRSRLEDTKDGPLFEGNQFVLLEECPWCGADRRLELQTRKGESFLACSACSKDVAVSLSKEDHGRLRPHLMLTTAESLDRMFFDADFEGYLASLHGAVLDEAHLYHGAYGVHIAHLLDRLRGEVREGSGRELAMILSSATIPHPDEFAGRLLFLGEPPKGADLQVVAADGYPMGFWGVEVFFFLQAPPRYYERALSTMIQTAMAMGHAVLGGQDRMLIFADSLDTVGRLHRKLKDAEENRRLWSFRMEVPNIQFEGNCCPRRTPDRCDKIYWEGECWRGIRGGLQCHQATGLRLQPLSFQKITGKTPGSRALAGEVVIGTSAMEVGIDDPSIRSTLHYRPPRTVFDFIQRRGRAGRSPDSLAYTVVVLGQDPSDHFYLFRRHRLIDGRYELPLNPDNPVIKRVHQALEEARQELRARRAGSEAEAIRNWFLDRLMQCHHVSGKYRSALEEARRQGWERLQKWVEDEKKGWEQQMGILWTLPELRWRFRTPAARGWFEALHEKVTTWLQGDLADDELHAELQKFISDAKEIFGSLLESGGYEASEDAKTLIQAAGQVRELAQRGRQAVHRTMEEARAWHDFFEELEALFQERWTRYLPSDVVRILYRAMYFLHEGLADHATCPGRIDVYVPDAYFESTRAVRVVAVTKSGQQTYSESRDLTFFVPYRLVYRYADNPSVLEGRTIRRGDAIFFRAYAQGPRMPDPAEPGKEVIQVRRLSMREVVSTEMDEVGLCLKCYQIHDSDLSGGRCGNCGHGEIRLGTLYVSQIYADHGIRGSEAGIPVAGRFEYLPHIWVWTRVRGSHVIFRSRNPEDRPRERQFDAWLDRPFYSDMLTRGIRWRVPGLSGSSEERKQRLHTAAHLLLRVMASITGVREDQLGYVIEEESVVVWERFEGGAGLAEVFMETLQKDPPAVYREMVAVAACPIYWAEQQGREWSQEDGSDLRDRLSRRFGLPPDDSIWTDIVQEALAEARRGEGQPTCSQEDGCPVCVETLECQDRRRGSRLPPASRTVAEELVASLARRLPASDWGREGIPGPVIWHDEGSGEDVVLVL